MSRILNAVSLFYCLAVFSVQVQAQELLTNGGLELVFPNQGGDDVVPDGWQKDESIPTSPQPNAQSLAEPSNFAHRLFEGEWQYWFQPYYGTSAAMEDNFAHLYQTVSGSSGMEYTMRGWAYFEIFFPGGVTNLNSGTAEAPSSCFPEPCDDGAPSPTDMYFGLDFLDSMGNILAGSVEIELKADGQPAGGASYVEHTLVGISPAGTSQVRVRATMLDGVLNPLPNPEGFSQSAFVDAFSLTAEEAEGIPGDFDGDLDVDGRDFLVWQRGESPSPLSASDLATWQASYGLPLAAITSVPEPATGTFIAMMLFGVYVMRCPNRRQRGNSQESN
jgi:hypothetical protein